MANQRTKIVCTMGPSTESDDVLRQMIIEGMRVARFNFSHGDHTYHAKGIRRVRRISEELGIDVALMADTKGPEIRTRLNEGGKPITFATGKVIRITSEDVKTTPDRIALDYAHLAKDVEPGSYIYVDDALIELEVIDVEGDEIVVKVINGGPVGERKGVNVPNVILALPAVTERDVDDITFACKMGMDAIAVSFVRDDDAPIKVRELCRERGREDMTIVSKIESSLALRNFDKILAASDVIMVARGDLGVEIAPASIPQTQKRIIDACNRNFKPVITATQMLESMTHNPRPTRAEVTDVANAIYDGTDCVMLSGETAAGLYPVEAVKMMASICQASEPNVVERHLTDRLDAPANYEAGVVGVCTGYAAVKLASQVGAVALLCPTMSGKTARIMSSLRPLLPIIVTSPHASTLKRACFMWGVEAILNEEQEGLSKTFTNAIKLSVEAGYIHTDDIVVITAGDPLTSPFTKGLETATNVCVVAQAL